MSAIRLLAVLCSATAVLLTCGTTSAAQSQKHVLTVRVTDPAGAAVPGARLTVSTRDSRARIDETTDGSGAARFELPDRDYLLEVAAAGFARVTRPIIASDDLTITVSLAIARVTERVVVTGSGRLQTAAEVSKAITVVDGDEIEARNELSVADALRTIPGATIQQLGGPGAFTSIKLRGLREQDAAVLIDGVRFRDAASPQGDATAFVGDLYVTDLDRIEVLRGSGSSLYGSHAVGGAVNLITRTGSGSTAGNIGAEAGGLGFRRASAHLGGSAWSTRVVYSIGGGHTRILHGVDGDDDARNGSAQGRGDLRLFGSARATVRAYVSDAASAVNESPAAFGPQAPTGVVAAIPLSPAEMHRYEAGTPAADLSRGAATFVPSANDPDHVRNSRFASMLARLEQRPSAGFGYTVSLHHLTTDRDFRDGPLGIPASEPAGESHSQFSGRVDTVDLRADREWSAHHVTTLGYEFEREQYESGVLPVVRLLAWQADITQRSHSLMLQQELHSNTMQVSAGFRAQRFSLDRTVFEPSERAPFDAARFTALPAARTADVAVARWIEGTRTKVRAHVGNAYRAPAMFERAGVSFGRRGYSVFGDPRLAPERSVSVDAGVDQALPGDRGRISATWFHTRLTSVIAFGSLDSATDPFGRASGYRTADGRRARGVELSARADSHSGLQVDLAYTFADSEAPAGSREGLPRAAAVPAHQLSVLLIQRIGRNLQLSLDMEAAGEHYVVLFDPISFASRAYRFEGLVKADVAGSYTLARGRAPVRVRLFGMIDNIADRSYFVQGFRTPGRTGRGGLAVTF